MMPPGYSTASRYRVWLSVYINGAYVRVSNYVEYEVDGMPVHELSIDTNYLVVRNGNTDQPLLWHIEKGGSTLTYSSVSDNLYWIDYNPVFTSHYNITLVSDDAYRTPLSNTVSYTYDTLPQPYSISFDGTVLTHDGNTVAPLTLVIEENGRIKAQINASGALTYTPGSLIIAGHRYRIWLEELFPGSYQRVSNLLIYIP